MVAARWATCTIRYPAGPAGRSRHLQDRRRRNRRARRRRRTCDGGTLGTHRWRSPRRGDVIASLSGRARVHVGPIQRPRDLATERGRPARRRLGCLRREHGGRESDGVVVDQRRRGGRGCPGGAGRHCRGSTRSRRRRLVPPGCVHHPRRGSPRCAGGARRSLSTTAGGADPLSTTVIRVTTSSCARADATATVEQRAVVPGEDHDIDGGRAHDSTGTRRRCTNGATTIAIEMTTSTATTGSIAACTALPNATRTAPQSTPSQIERPTRARSAAVARRAAARIASSPMRGARAPHRRHRTRR